jgi:hypothetical protein
MEMPNSMRARRMRWRKGAEEACAPSRGTDSFSSQFSRFPCILSTQHTYLDLYISGQHKEHVFRPQYFPPFEANGIEPIRFYLSGECLTIV